MSDETYNGWSNWETWNAQLWLTNDEWTYNQCLELAVDNVTDVERGEQPRAYPLAIALQDMVEEYKAEGVRLIGDEMSHWRIEWVEIAEAWQDMAREAIDYEGATG